MEDVTGHAVKLLVRADAIPFKFAVIAVLILITVVVVATTRKPKQD